MLLLNPPEKKFKAMKGLAYSIRHQNLSDSLRKKANKWDKVINALQKAKQFK